MLIRLRFEYLTEDRGEISDEDRQALNRQLPRYFADHIGDNTFIGILALIGGEAAGTAYLAISEMPANTTIITGKRGMLLNVYTLPRHRRKGIASMAVRRVLDEAKLLGCSYVELSATDAGKGMYERLGFSGESKYTHMGMRLIEWSEQIHGER